jgi:hypothetical protein
MEANQGEPNGQVKVEPSFYGENEEEQDPETFDFENIDMEEQKRIYEALQQSKTQPHYE